MSAWHRLGLRCLPPIGRNHSPLEGAALSLLAGEYLRMPKEHRPLESICAFRQALPRAAGAASRRVFQSGFAWVTPLTFQGSKEAKCSRGTAVEVAVRALAAASWESMLAASRIEGTL